MGIMKITTKTKFEIKKLPKIVTFEGIDGSGKSTQAELLYKNLFDHGLSVALCRNPREDQIGEYIRKLAGSVLPEIRRELFALDLIQTLYEKQDCDVLVWDRYIDSGITSNKEYTVKESLEFYKSFPKPDLTFFLEIRPSLVLESRKNSLHDHSSDLKWQNFKIKQYKKLINIDKERFIVLNGGLSMKELQNEILKITLKNLYEK